MPLGDKGLPATRAQNKLVGRVILLLRLACYFGAFWMIEQPTSSLLNQHPKFRKSQKALGMREVFFWMQFFGADSPKDTKLWSNVPYLGLLENRLSKNDLASTSGRIQTAKTTVNRDGKASVSGGKDLKSTQAYPPFFGLAVASLHKEAMIAKHDEVESVASDSDIDDDSSSSSSSDASNSCVRDILEELAKA